MTIRIMGSILIILGFGSIGFLASTNHKKEISTIKCFLESLNRMESELRYRKTPLPYLCHYLGTNANGVIKEFYINLSNQLQGLDHADAAACVAVSIERLGHLPDNVRKLLLMLGQSLGQFDLEGQICSIQGVKEECYSLIGKLSENQEQKRKSYRALGLCAGAAVAILFI